MVESGLNSEISNSAGNRTFGSGGVPPGETVAVDGWISGTAEMEAYRISGTKASWRVTE